MIILLHPYIDILVYRLVIDEENSIEHSARYTLGKFDISFQLSFLDELTLDFLDSKLSSKECPADSGNKV